MSTGSEPFSLSTYLDVTKFVLPMVFTLTETICRRVSSKSRPKSAKKPLPVDVVLKNARKILVLGTNQKRMAAGSLVVSDGNKGRPFRLALPRVDYCGNPAER